MTLSNQKINSNKRTVIKIKNMNRYTPKLEPKDTPAKGGPITSPICQDKLNTPLHLFLNILGARPFTSAGKLENNIVSPRAIIPSPITAVRHLLRSD